MFIQGTRVRLTKDHKELRFVETFRAGEVGTLGQRYRVQDGVEIWQVVLEERRAWQGRLIPVILAVPHTDMETC